MRLVLASVAEQGDSSQEHMPLIPWVRGLSQAPFSFLSSCKFVFLVFLN